MRLIAIPAWLEKHFDKGGAPEEVTVRRWLREGVLPGRKIGGLWFIDEAAWLADGDDLVQRVLEGAA